MPISLGSELDKLFKTAPETALEIKTEFAIPRLLLQRLPEEQRPTSGACVKTVALGFKIEALAYSFPDAQAAAKAWSSLVSACADGEMAVTAVHGASDDGGYAGPVMALASASVEEDFGDAVADGHLARFYDVILADLKTVGRFSRLTGLRVRYCLDEELVQAPRRYQEGVLNLLVGARAPGAFRIFSQPIKTLFGCKMWADGETRSVHGPTAWRGRLVAAEGVPIFQIIGNNVYSLALLLAESGNRLERERLWQHVLSLLAADLAGTHDERLSEPTSDELRRCIRDMTQRRSQEVRKGLRKLDAELEELQRKLTEKLRERAIQVANLKAQEADVAGLAERAGADFERLRAMKADIVSIHAHPEDGLMVQTVPIIFERHGRRYDLGPFRIHVSADGQVAVWSEAPRHPKGHHHPHIDKTSLECFGNITLAVAKLATSYRLAETIELILRWLRSYRPELTLIPLEEFPSEPLAEAVSASQGACHAD